MVKKYVMVRMPIESHDLNKKKRDLMVKRVKSWTGKDVKISMTDAYRVFAKTPNEIPEVNVIRLVKKKNGRVFRC